MNPWAIGLFESMLPPNTYEARPRQLLLVNQNLSFTRPEQWIRNQISAVTDAAEVVRPQGAGGH